MTSSRLTLRRPRSSSFGSGGCRSWREHAMLLVWSFDRETTREPPQRVARPSCWTFQLRDHRPNKAVVQHGTLRLGSERGLTSASRRAYARLGTEYLKSDQVGSCSRSAPTCILGSFSMRSE